MDAAELAVFAHELIHSRQNVSPKRLVEPGPSPTELQDILATAGAAPDHGMLMPWRFVVVPAARRAALAEVFATALQERDPLATAQQIDSAREKAYRAPFLMLAVVRLQAKPGDALLKPAPDEGNDETTVCDAERLVSLGCAIQNIILAAHAGGFGSGLTSGQAMGSPPLRALFSLTNNEQAVCCINLGTVSKHRPIRLRPGVIDYVSELR
ncbi:nitroreductase family protein [Rhodoferax sp.]|uniref:nitroreductase family protein n=1 Tax=Rhodoferax sp. TaxID=50421 RepID=UPI00274DFB3B|nr:nitroreductase family protein [Rhodoferax sp.]